MIDTRQIPETQRPLNPTLPATGRLIPSRTGKSWYCTTTMCTYRQPKNEHQGALDGFISWSEQQRLEAVEENIWSD